jgi:glycosyltransferase involved in cell wall biosynthesis
MSGKNILFLSYDGLTDPLGQSQILPYLCGLSRCGHNITVVSFEKPERYASQGNRIKELCFKHSLNWSPLQYHKWPPVLSTLYDVWTLRRTCRILEEKHHFNIVHCRSYVTSLVGVWMKSRYKLRFVFDMRGFWADERVEGGLWRLTNPIHRMIYTFFKWKEKQFLRLADHIISLTENAKQEILTWSISTASITVIPTCVDVNYFDPLRITVPQQEQWRNTLNIKPDKFVLLYLGSIGTWYMMEEMLIFFSQLKRIEPNALFLIVSPDRPDLEKFQYRSDVIVKKASHEDVPLYISLANASVFFIYPSFSKKASSATKMAEVLAMGIPVVTNRGWGDVSKYESLLTGFEVVSDRHDYANAVFKLTSNSYDQGKIRLGSINHFSLSHGVSRYDWIYKDLA